MSVVMVGRREEKLNQLAEEIKATYSMNCKVVRADFSLDGEAEKVFAAVLYFNYTTMFTSRASP